MQSEPKSSFHWMVPILNLFIITLQDTCIYMDESITTLDLVSVQAHSGRTERCHADTPTQMDQSQYSIVLEGTRTKSSKDPADIPLILTIKGLKRLPGMSPFRQTQQSGNVVRDGRAMFGTDLKPADKQSANLAVSMATVSSPTNACTKLQIQTV